MADLKWKASGRASNPETLISPNSLGVGASDKKSSAISNATDLDLFCDFELVVTFGTAPTAGGLVKLYLVRNVDGTNDEDATESSTPVVPQNGYVGAFVVRAVTTAQRMIIPQVELPPRDFNILLVNGTSQSFPASGCTLKGYFYKYQIA